MTKIKMKLIGFTAAAMVASVSVSAKVPKLKVNNIDAVIKAMTIEEKADLIVGARMYHQDENAAPHIKESWKVVPGAAGRINPVPRVGIPCVVLSDGPAGCGILPVEGEENYFCTHFPIETLLSSTWDVDLVRNVGEVIGNEAKEYGVDVLLAPAINIHRHPLCGRNFEYFSEDPLLAGKMAVAYVDGVQSNDIGTSVKHFAVNNQETNRMNNNAIVSPRALREIYLKAFEIVVKESQPWTIMSSYNRINDVYASESPELITTILRDEWGYKGTVMTDWWGGADGAAQMIAGNEDIVVSQQEVEALRHELGLDKPFIFQYLDWLGRAVQGNFGFSYMVKKPVIEELMHSLPATVILAVASTVFMLLVSIPAGIYSAVKHNSWFDYMVRGLTFVGVSVPNFWMGLMLLWIFGLKLGLLPIVGGRVSPETLVLPALTLGIVMAAKYTRQVRATVLEELNQDYVVGARARGMSESHILWKEVLPNAMLPLITLLGLSFGNLLGGAAVVEIVFSWPGLGYLAVQSIIYRDFQLVQGIVLWIALMYMVINLIVDISYNHLDPRLRKAGK